jgi:hypothetical protein
MLAEHAHILAKQTMEQQYSFMGLDYVVWDWLLLGVLTGSRVAEYAWSGLWVNQRYQKILKTGDASKWVFGQIHALFRTISSRSVLTPGILAPLYSNMNSE